MWKTKTSLFMNSTFMNTYSHHWTFITNKPHINKPLNQLQYSLYLCSRILLTSKGSSLSFCFSSFISVWANSGCMLHSLCIQISILVIRTVYFKVLETESIFCNWLNLTDDHLCSRKSNTWLQIGAKIIFKCPVIDALEAYIALQAVP